MPVDFVYSRKYFNIGPKVSFLNASAACLTNCVCVKVIVVLTVAAGWHNAASTSQSLVSSLSDASCLTRCFKKKTRTQNSSGVKIPACVLQIKWPGRLSLDEERIRKVSCCHRPALCHTLLHAPSFSPHRFFLFISLRSPVSPGVFL